MSVLFVVLPVAVALSGLAAGAFAWATRRGQFDDLETPALRLLTDDLAERERETKPPPTGESRCPKKN